MELRSAEVESLRKLVTAWIESPNQELEATFGIGGRVDITTFLSVAKRLRARGYTSVPQEDRLTITLPEHVRFALKGMGVIQNYCRDDLLAGKPFVAMIKDRTIPNANVDLDDYSVRIKARREIDLADDGPEVKKILMTWKEQRKAFRMIRRWSFEIEGMVIDLSVVRGTARDTVGNYKWQKSFKDQNVMASAPFYEIEVELHRIEGDTAESAMKRLIKGAGEVLRGIQKHTFLIRAPIKEKALRGYKDLTGTDRFRGVAPVTMEMANFAKERVPKKYNIRDGYNVTDKADGLRVMAFCDKDGELFMIDMSLNVYKTGLTNPNTRLSLMDGEWVTQTRDKRPIQQLLLFDCYISPDKKDSSQLPFHSADPAKETRHGMMKRWIDLWNDGVKAAPGVTAATKLQVAMKTFYFAEKDNLSIFVSAARMLDTQTIYYTDGLIFTPNDLPIPNQTKFLAQFKWKPAEDNTIDFLVAVEKFTGSKNERITVGVKPNTGETLTYKTLRLLVGSDKETAIENPREVVLQELGLAPAQKVRGRNLYKPVPFNPKEFPDTMASICYLEIKNDPETGEDYIMTADKDSPEPIQNKSIVEMAYDPSEDPGWRWKPLRVRMDKTERLLKGELGRTLNADFVAEGVWNSIHDPITESMIRTGNDEPADEEVADLSKEMKERESVGRRYYDRKAPAQDLRIVGGLRKFHNRWIKEKILYHTGLYGGKKTLLDLAVGRAADLQIWRRAGVSFVFGVDNAGENITEPDNGAYGRYINTVKDYGRENVVPMIFAIADSSKILVDGTAGATEQEKDILRAVLGRVRPSGALPPFVEKEGAGRLKMGADCVSVMFALHYFFEKKEMFDGFLRNVADGLKVGGHFIGCCFDGDAVFQLLRGVTKGVSKSGMDGNSLIWSLTKQYDADELPEDESVFGMGIDVEFISIGTSHREYLVPFKFLVKKMASIGCELLDEKEMAEVGLQQSTSLFQASHTMAENAGFHFKMSKPVEQFSFLNRWFVFRRKRQVVLEEEAVSVVSMPGALSAPGAPSAVAALSGKKTAVVAPVVVVPTAVPSSAPSAPSVPSAATAEPSAPSAAAPAPVPAVPGQPITSGIVAAQIKGQEAPLRTLPVAATAARSYALGEVFQFYNRAALQDKLKIGDKGAGRWLAPSAPFPIEDDGVVYPTMEHYMGAMLYKLATNKPDLAVSLLSRDGTIHQEFVDQRLKETKAGSVALSQDRDYDLLEEEMKRVREAIRPPTMKKYGVTINVVEWAKRKDEVLRKALRYRWENDKRLRTILEAARSQGKVLLYYTPGASSSNLGGVRREDGSIEGDNKIGRILMELANFPT